MLFLWCSLLSGTLVPLLLDVCSGSPNGFFKACPEAHSDSLAYPLCNRLFIGPKLWIGIGYWCMPILSVFSVTLMLPYWYLVSAGVGGFLNARPSG